MKVNNVLNAKIKSIVQIQPIYRVQHIANQCAEMLLRIGRFIASGHQSDPVSTKLIELSLMLAALASQLTSQPDENQQLALCNKCQLISLEANAMLRLCLRTGIVKQFDVQELNDKLAELIALTKTIESQIKFK